MKPEHLKNSVERNHDSESEQWLNGINELLLRMIDTRT